MRRGWGLLLPLGIGFIIAFIGTARAHDWYSSTQDPVFQSSCCGGHDCAPISPEFITIEGDGYRVRMTAEESRTVNKNSSQPVDAFVPGSRVQTPPNGEHAFYACIYDTDRAAPRKGVICFFATPTM